MKKNLKKILVPFILMVVINLGSFYFSIGKNFAEGYSPHLGIIFISGLLFGPYGAIGSVLGNTLCDLVRGYGIEFTVISEIVSFSISILGYKLWYEKFRTKRIITAPNLTDTTQMLMFMGIILVCGAVFSIITKKLFFFYKPETIPISFLVGVRYFINFVNSAFIFGIIGILLSKYIDFIHIPKKSDKKFNKRAYEIIGAILLASTIILTITDYYFNPSKPIIIAEAIIIIGLLILYITKPITAEVEEISYNRIPERIMKIFLITTLIILIIGYAIASDHVLAYVLDLYLPIDIDEIILLVFLIMDIFYIIFFIPSILILRYIESNVINPIVSFSGIEKFIRKGDRIESDGLINVYSEYINENDEIGMLARSYTSLITYTMNILKIFMKLKVKNKELKQNSVLLREFKNQIFQLKELKMKTFVFMDSVNLQGK